MENVMSPPPSSGFTVHDASRQDKQDDTTGYALAAGAAFASVTGLGLWGLGVAGSFEGPSAALFVAQVAGGVVLTVGFGAQAVRSFWSG